MQYDAGSRILERWCEGRMNSPGWKILFICSGVVSTPFAGVVVYDDRAWARSCPFYSSMRSIACLSYRITPLNITSCGCRVQTNGVRNAPFMLCDSLYWVIQILCGIWSCAILSYMVPCPGPSMHFGRLIGLRKMIISKSPNCEATGFHFQQSSCRCDAKPLPPHHSTTAYLMDYSLFLTLFLVSEVTASVSHWEGKPQRLLAH